MAKDLLTKILKTLPPGAREDLDALNSDPEALANAVVKAEEVIRDAERERDEDEKLAGAKEIVKDIASGYSDVVKAQRSKIAYALYLKEGTVTKIRTNKKDR